MARPPHDGKHKLDFILNEEGDSSKDKEQSRRRHRGTHRTGQPAEHVHTPLDPEAFRRAKQSHRKPSSSASPLSSSAAQTGYAVQASSSQSRFQRNEDEQEQHRPYQCELCTKAFVERGNLNKHITSVHLKEKTKICPEPGCGKSFSFRDGLVRHIAHVHKNERAHVCLLCQRAFKQASHLQKHLKSIHKAQ